MGMLSRVFGRSASPDAIRGAEPESFDQVGTGGYGRYQNSLWGEATSSDSRIPHYRTPSPLEMLPDQRRLRSIVRHLVRTNPRIRPAMIKKVEIVVGSSVKPKSRFKELADLFVFCCDQFDTRGETDFAGLIAELVWNYLQDGDAALRKRVRQQRGDWADLTVPIQFQALTCDWMPDDYEGYDAAGLRYVHGVAIVNDRKKAYAVYSEHPTDAMRYGRVARILHVPASEIYHVFKSSTGVPRGETPLTAAISTAEDLADLMAHAAQRRKNMTALATFFEQAGTTIDAAPPIMGETDTKRSTLTKWMQNLFLRPGDAVLLPPGLKANTQAPAGDMPGHDTTVKIETMVLCAIIGVPYHQAMGDWKEAPERAMRFAGADLKTHVTILRRQIEHQCLRKLYRDFVNVAMAVGAWTPPPGATEAEIYEHEWQWPVIQQATLDRELNVMLAMVAAGVLPPSVLVEDYFGIQYPDMTRRYADDAATATANGMLQFTDKWKAATEVSKRILAEAEARESHERDLVDEAKLDRSVLGSPVD